MIPGLSAVPTSGRGCGRTGISPVLPVVLVASETTVLGTTGSGVLDGTGVVFAGAAVGAWAYSGSLANSYVAECNAGPCDQAKETPIRTWETLSFVSAGVAVVSAGVGITLLLTAPKERAVAVSATTNGVWLTGSF